jgi:hypothetical protein
MVQKAAVAGAPLLAAVSAPTSLAVETADAAQMALVGLARQGKPRRLFARRTSRVRGTGTPSMNNDNLVRMVNRIGAFFRIDARSAGSARRHRDAHPALLGAAHAAPSCWPTSTNARATASTPS